MVQILFSGIISIVLAILPFWLTGLSIYQKNQLWSDRLALAAMGGASMLMVGMIYTLVTLSALSQSGSEYLARISDQHPGSDGP